MTKKEERAIALRMFAEPCTGKSDRFHAGNCPHCALRGEGRQGTVDGKGLEPNYAGWARLYVQAERTIPARFSAAFAKEMRSDNTAYAEALADDIATYGVTIEQV